MPPPFAISSTFWKKSGRLKIRLFMSIHFMSGFPPIINDTIAKPYYQYMPNQAPVWTQSRVAALGPLTMRFEIRVTAIIH